MFPRPTVAIAFAIATTALAADEITKGTFCLGESRMRIDACTSVEGSEITVAPAEKERLFVWTTSDSKSTVAGVLAKNADKITLKGPDWRDVKFSVRGDDRRGWPADLRLSLTTKEHQWTWTIPTGAAWRPQSIHVPEGTYTIALSADHHRTLYRRGVDLTRAERIALGELRLEPLPLVRGVVIDSEQKTLEGARIIAAEKLCTATDERGTFRCELAEPIPEEISVEHPGFGRRFFALPRQVADHDLRRITLSRGSRVLLRIQRRDELLEREIDVALLHDIPENHEHVKVATAKLKPQQPEIAFSDVGPGKYFALVSGSAPLERLSVAVDVKEGTNAEKTVEIQPFLLKGEVFFGEKAIAAEGSVHDPAQSWSSEFGAPDGRFGGVMWQRGKVWTWIKVKDLGSFELVESPQLGEDPSSWPIVIKERLITGRLYDAQSNAPIGDAGISLQIHMTGDAKAYSSTRASEDGTYRILASRAGEYHLSFESKGYIPASMTVTVKDEDATKRIDLPMERGIEVVFELVWPNGAPIPNAVVVEGFGTEGINPGRFDSADAAGRLRMRLSKDQKRTLYIFPQEGSFAVLRARGGDEPRTERIVIPAAAATLRVRAVDSNGKPVSLWPLLRYNGDFLPSSVSAHMMPSWRESNLSGEILLRGLPPGFYEIWGFRRPEEQFPFIAAGGGIAPVRIGLSTGEETVQITVPARE